MDVGVQIEFLVTPQLSVPSSPQYGEWPPAPDRVFQALVATAAETGQDFQVLSHLESAPAIQASTAVPESEPVLRYVPDNYRRTSRYHQGAARYLPTMVPDSPVVTYMWSDVPTSAVSVLKNISENITHIGRASSLARGSLVDPQTVKADWLPDKQGDMLLRVPYPGRLKSLEESFNAGLRSSPAPEVGYRSADTVYQSTEWEDLMVLRPERQLEVSETPLWTDRLRRAVMSKLGDNLPAFIHGHGEHRHLAWNAIPDVGHKHARGGILGIGCWLPTDISLKERGLIGSVLMRLTELNGLRLRLDQVGLKGLQAATWGRTSKLWATATPIALDRWPKRNNSPEMIISRSLEAMGLPQPHRVTCSTRSPLKGTIDSRSYPARRSNRYITHAEIEWSRPIQGPLLIGADRYFGGGLCRPIAERRN